MMMGFEKLQISNAIACTKSNDINILIEYLLTNNIENQNDIPQIDEFQIDKVIFNLKIYEFLFNIYILLLLLLGYCYCNDR